jgi:hypothetical protein
MLVLDNVRMSMGIFEKRGAVLKKKRARRAEWPGRALFSIEPGDSLEEHQSRRTT